MITAEPNEPTIITAFFDLGRENWAGQVSGSHIAPWVSQVEVPAFFARSNQVYLDRFAYLAAIKNPMVVFTEDRFCQFVADARAVHGLQERTRVVACKNPFTTSTPLDHAIDRTRLAIVRPEFGSFVARPYCPEHWNAHYVVMTMFKFTIVSTAIKMGAVKTPSLAWIDFGYCRDDERFDKARPWSFPCNDQIHLFYVQEPDDRPVFDVVRTGTTYFQGCHMVSPTAIWGELYALVEDAFRSLLDCGLPDDEQTAMLMAYRRAPSLFNIHAVDPSDWFVIFKRTWDRK